MVVRQTDPSQFVKMMELIFQQQDSEYYYYTVKWELFDCHAIFKANTHSPTLKSYASSMYRYICIIVNATSWIHCDFIPRNKVAAAIYYETLLIPDTVQCS